MNDVLRRQISRACLSGLCIVFLLFAALGCGQQQQQAPVMDLSSDGAANLKVPQSTFHKVEITKPSGPMKGRPGGAKLPGS
jgi:hypothetical protein